MAIVANPIKAARQRLMTRSARAPLFNRGLIAETGIIPAGYHFLQDTYSWKIKDFKPIAEAVTKNGEPIMRVTGLFQEGDIKNANERVYPTDILQYAIQLIQEDMQRRAVYGEYDHPPDAKIHMDRISHLVTKGWMEGRKIYGESEILDNQPHGRCLRGLFERKCQVGISSRGIGDMELRESGGDRYYEVQPGYQFVTWDAVAEPSVHGATLTVMENLNKKLRPIHDAAKRGEFLSKEHYEDMLLEGLNKFFEIKDIGPRRFQKPVARSTFRVR